MTLNLDDFEPVAYSPLFNAMAAATKNYASVGISISVKAFTEELGDVYAASKMQQLIDQCNAKDEEITSLLDVRDRQENYMASQGKRLATLQTQNAELLADAERYRNLKPIIDQFPEINPSNYDHDDVCHLNGWGVELVLAEAAKTSN